MAELKDKLVSLEGLQIFYNAFADAGRIPAFDAQNESMVLAIKDGIPQWVTITQNSQPSEPSTPAYTARLLTLNDLIIMATGATKTIVMISPHSTQGYILGHNGTSAVGGEAHSYANRAALDTAVENCKGNDTYKFIITRISNGYTLKSVQGNMSPNKNGNTVSWSSTTQDTFTLSNPTAEMDNLVSGISAIDNPNMIRFTNNGSYLNTGGSATALKYATGTGGWSAWYLYEITHN